MAEDPSAQPAAPARRPQPGRRARDRIIGIALVALAITAALVVGARSDARSTVLVEGPSAATPEPPDTVPERADEAWRAKATGAAGAVASPYGTVVMAGADGVRGLSASTGDELWSYTRPGLRLCAVGDGDTLAEDLDSWTGVHGVMTLFAKNGWCSQVTLHDPLTGARLFQRTSPNQEFGRLVYGAPYAGWAGRDYLELWRHDLVATIRYGDQPNPVNTGGPRLGCEIRDVAVTAMNLATIEHCPSVSDDVRLVLNWPTPADAPEGSDRGWDANNSEPRADIDTGSADAVIVSIAEDGVAILVSDPSPTLVVYGTDGQVVSRTASLVDADDIRATSRAGITPVRSYRDHRLALVGDHLVVTSKASVMVPDTTPVEEDEEDGEDAQNGDEDGETDADVPADNGDGAEPPAPQEPALRPGERPVFDWAFDGALGLPALIAGSAVIPTASGWTVVGLADGAPTSTVPLARDYGNGRIDAAAVGEMIVETSGDVVVAYRG